MSSTVPVTELRGRLSEVIDAVVDTGEEWILTRRGKPLAVVLSYEEYESLIETINILSDSETMAAVTEGLAELSADTEPKS